MRIKDEYKRILNVTIEISNKAANLIRGMSKNANNIIISNKDVNDFVTNVDKASEELYISELKKYFPDFDILAEETGGKSKSSNPKWIIDPIDGTTNFTKGIPIYGISIGLEVDSEIVLGVVNHISMNEVFTAVKGGGSHLNGGAIRVSLTDDIDRILIGTGFPFRRGSDFSSYIRVFEALAKTTAGIRRPGSASIDLCWTACGRYDAFFEFGLNPWDVSAGSLIVKEAGGIITESKGEMTLYMVELCLLLIRKRSIDFIFEKIKNTLL
jgi:myo-inositol-1(or 4)-monophosphatase